MEIVAMAYDICQQEAGNEEIMPSCKVKEPNHQPLHSLVHHFEIFDLMPQLFHSSHYVLFHLCVCVF